MPKSRNRPRDRRKKKTRRRNPLALDRVLDLTVQEAYRIVPPPVLYHYTSRLGAEGILRGQTFWATAHSCTNDEAELVSADDIIMDVAEQLRTSASGVAHAALKLFLEGYLALQVTKLMPVYLACFSVARDDPEQWRKYADEGRGFCLGLRMLDEPGPTSPDLGSALIKVDYSEQSWRADVERHFQQVCSLLERAARTRSNVKLGLSALYRIAAFASMGAKQKKWAVEQEYRNVTVIHKDACIEPKERLSDGKTIQYLPIVVRANGKRMALAEVLIGPNQDADAARASLAGLLSEAGYNVGDMEYPKVITSEVGRLPQSL